MRLTRSLILVLIALVWACTTEVFAQSLSLRTSDTDAGIATAQVGDILAIDILADLSGFTVSGTALFISIPRGSFKVVTESPVQRQEVQPFQQGPLFRGAVEFSNALMPRSEVPNFIGDVQLLSYATLLGPGENRSRTGTGVVATFHLLCVQPVAAAHIDVVRNPIYETRLVLSDGHSERFFRTTRNLEITVEPSTRLDLSFPSKTGINGQTWGRLKARFTN